MPKRTAWLLIAGGLGGVAAGTALSITLTTGFLFIGFLGGLACAIGVTGLAEHKWIALPAFLLGAAAPFLLTFGGHSVLMQRIGHVEHCTVTHTQEHPFNKHPSVDYTLVCPSTTVELDRNWDERLNIMEADVLIGEPLQPVFADQTRWNLLLVTSVPLAMILLIPVARALRKVP
ncbi:hypothetical protein [Lentzea aerocolonigenes]|uniref:hypothetical protein n=1 Tax=Lentzea aerocolonigenes TaxID=68170 RepID=UPI0012E2F263|nr:hypothetical protein [Lentzea aerocolonigenes]